MTTSPERLPFQSTFSDAFAIYWARLKIFAAVVACAGAAFGLSALMAYCSSRHLFSWGAGVLVIFGLTSTIIFVLVVGVVWRMLVRAASRGKRSVSFMWRIPGVALTLLIAVVSASLTFITTGFSDVVGPILIGCMWIILEGLILPSKIRRERELEHRRLSAKPNEDSSHHGRHQ